MEKAILIILTFSGVLLARAVWRFVSLSWAPNAKLPGPWYTRYTSIPLKYKTFKGTGAAWVAELHQKYGKIVRVSPNEVDFSSINALKTIHSYRKAFMKSSFYEIFDKEQGESSILSTPNAATHGRFRRLMANSTSESSIKQVEEFVQSKVELTLQRMEEDMMEHGYVDVLKWWTYMATDVSAHLSFGESFRMLEQKKKNQYVEDLESITLLLGIRSTFPQLFRFTTKYKIPIFKKTMAIVDRLYTYADESLKRHQRMETVDPENFKPTFFTNLLHAGEKGGDTISWEEIIGNAQVFIIAGADTTAHTLTYLAWQLSKAENSHVKAKLLEELAALGGDDFTNEDLKPLPYLNNVISETLRLYSPVPGGLPRDVPRGGALVDGVFLPEGTVAITQAYSVHRDPEIFPDPESFDPSRWETPTKDMKDAFMAFGCGPRVCIGIHLAYMELRLATAKFFQKFPHSKVSTREGFCDEDMKMRIAYLMAPEGHRCLLEL